MASMASHTGSQKYLSTRGGSFGVSFEEAVLKGLAPDNGLFIPEEIPSLPPNWHQEWLHLSFEDLAFQILSLYISPTEISPSELKAITRNSYSTFRVPDITPTIALNGQRGLYLLELFHGPTFAFKDVALQFLGNLLEFFLVRKNKGKTGKDREHLAVIGATSGDTGAAAIYGLKGKKDVSIFILYPNGKISPIQEAQMTSVQDQNVRCLSLDGTFDDCQDTVKALFADPLTNKSLKLCGVNSINISRILAQVTYYFASYFSLVRSGTLDPSTNAIRFITPSGNFGNVLAGYLAKRMGLPISKLIIATNENDILYRFWQTGAYEKQPIVNNTKDGVQIRDGARPLDEYVKETLSPAMDIQTSSNVERLLWFIAFDICASDPSIVHLHAKRLAAGSKVKAWQDALKTKGGFKVENKVLEIAREHFASERVSDPETVTTIREVYSWPHKGSKGYILDPHSAIGVAAALRLSKPPPGGCDVALSTAHPAKFSRAVEMALAKEEGFQFKDILPPQFVGLEDLPRRQIHVQKSGDLDGIRKILIDEVEKELERQHA